MPRYDYKCIECETVIEYMHSMSSTPDVHCPKCKKLMAKQIGNGSGIIFKGTGFYKTDYKT